MSVSITLRPQSSAKGRSRPLTGPKRPLKPGMALWVRGSLIANRSLVVSGAHGGVICGYPRRVRRCFDCQTRRAPPRGEGEDLCLIGFNLGLQPGVTCHCCSPIASLSPGGVEKSDLCPMSSQTFLLPRVTVARNRGAVPRLEARKSPRLRSTAL